MAGQAVLRSSSPRVVVQWVVRCLFFSVCMFVARPSLLQRLPRPRRPRGPSSPVATGSSSRRGSECECGIPCRASEGRRTERQT